METEASTAWVTCPRYTETKCLSQTSTRCVSHTNSFYRYYLRALRVLGHWVPGFLFSQELQWTERAGGGSRGLQGKVPRAGKAEHAPRVSGHRASASGRLTGVQKRNHRTREVKSPAQGHTARGRRLGPHSGLQNVCSELQRSADKGKVVCHSRTLPLLDHSPRGHQAVAHAAPGVRAQ